MRELHHLQQASAALRLGELKLRTILAMTEPVVGNPVLTNSRAALRDAALAVRRARRGPSKLGRRVRRNVELGRAGRH